MSQNGAAQDPLEFVRGMWNNMGFALPGMVTPTLDVDELDKRISDLKTVENWLKMNLNMLQMTIQGLEMQRVAIAAVKAMSEQATESRTQGDPAEDNPFAAAALWPWNLMQQAQDAAGAPDAQPGAVPRKAKPRTRAGTRKPTEK